MTLTDIAPPPQTPNTGNLGQPVPPHHPENGEWRPQSKRVGMPLVRYVWWNWCYAVMEFFNRALARDPNRKISWDKWPPIIGLFYLISKMRFVRSNSLTDPYDYKSNDNDPPTEKRPGCPFAAIAADGKWAADDQSARMGAAMTRYSSNIAPRKVRPDVEKMTPSARDISKMLRERQLDSQGNIVTTPALILNVVAQAWIQFQFHNFGGNTLRDPLNKNPFQIPRNPNENWPNNQATVDRTTLDPTRVGYDGRPTPMNEKVHAWVQGQLYGNNEAEQKRLRTFAHGHLALDADGLMLEDPARPGVDMTGFNNNYNPWLSFLHWLFTKDHNAIADYLHAFDPTLNDEELFQLARKTNCAQIARIHTTEWTEDLLQHPTLQLAMHADWYGLLGMKKKMYLMRLMDRHPFIKKILTPLHTNDILWGAPGSKWEHFDGPFQVPKHFRLVYRLHELILDETEVLDPATGKLLAKVDLINFIHEHTRPHIKRYGYATLGWSFLSKSCGALTLHNFPRGLTQFNRMQDNNLIDLAELDIFREREDGTGSYNEFRRSMGEPPVTTFLELTGGDAELAKEIERVYGGDINKVDPGVGILAEPKPAGFALGFVQFYQFILNAPRRVKSNRFLSEGYYYAEYKQGMNWVEHANGLKGAIRRHLPELEPKLEGVLRGFAPWPDTETFPDRLLAQADGDIASAFFTDLRTWALGTLASTLAIYHHQLPAKWLLSALAIFLVATITMGLYRLLGRRLLQICEKKCNTDKRGYFFGSLYEAETKIRGAAHAGSFWSFLAIIASITCAILVGGRHPWSFALFLITALSAISTHKWSKAFTDDLQIVKVALRNRMRNGQPQTSSPTSPPSEPHKELHRQFRTYAPGRHYLTAYDFARMHETEGSNSLNKHFHMTVNHLLLHYADLIVEEDRNLVPAITKKTCEQLLTGAAQKAFKHEYTQGDRDPSPKNWN